MKKKIIPASFLRLISIIIFWLQKPSRNRKITISLLVLSFIFSIVTYLVFTNSLPLIETPSAIAVTTLTIDVAAPTPIVSSPNIDKVYSNFCFNCINTNDYPCYFFFTFF